MTNSFVRNMLNEQRKRLVGSLMQYLEENVFDRLDEQERRELRKKVLSSASQYHDVCLDMLKSSVNDGTVLNEEALRLLSSIHAQTQRLTNRSRGW